LFLTSSCLSSGTSFRNLPGPAPERGARTVPSFDGCLLGSFRCPRIQVVGNRGQRCRSDSLGLKSHPPAQFCSINLNITPREEKGPKFRYLDREGRVQPNARGPAQTRPGRADCAFSLPIMCIGLHLPRPATARESGLSGGFLAAWRSCVRWRSSCISPHARYLGAQIEVSNC
jgi:hypothetical protein